MCFSSLLLFDLTLLPYTLLYSIINSLLLNKAAPSKFTFFLQKVFRLVFAGDDFMEKCSFQETSARFRQFVFTSGRQFRKIVFFTIPCSSSSLRFWSRPWIQIQDFTMNLTGAFGCFT